MQKNPPCCIANMETDKKCCIQDNCQSETDTRYCLGSLVQTDTRFPNRYSIAKQILVCQTDMFLFLFWAFSLAWYQRELIRPQIPALCFKYLTRTSVAVQPEIYRVSSIILCYYLVVFLTKLHKGSKKIDNIKVNLEKQSNGPDYRVSFNPAFIIIYFE